MRVRATPLFQSQKVLLRKSQIRQLDYEVERIMDDPTIGDKGKEDLEGISYHRYEDRYGRMLIAYQIKNRELRLLVLARISIKFE